VAGCSAISRKKPSSSLSSAPFAGRASWDCAYKRLNVMEAASVTGHKTLQMLKRYTHLSVTDLATRLG
jgi:hypothetical protein